MFEKISTAYQVLSCDSLRREYDISRGDQQFKYTKQSSGAISRYSHMLYCMILVVLSTAGAL